MSVEQNRNEYIASIADNLNLLYNTVVGTWALDNNSTGNHNTAVGFNALESNTSGSNNSALGEGSLGSNVLGSNNVAIGKDAMKDNTVGNCNTAIGANSSVSEALTNATAIGYLAIADKSQSVKLGNNAVTVVETNGSFEALDIGDGFICKSPSGSRWKITVTDLGGLQVTPM